MDDELQVAGAGKKKRVISSSSSDEDLIANQNKTPKCNRSGLQTEVGVRSSERIRKRQNRTFSRPSKEDLVKDIPTGKNVEKEIRKLTPKKLINNFTKENHRYNFDPVYTSGEESFDDFINDESESGTSEGSSGSNRRKKPCKKKVKYFHPRIKKESSSDSDSGLDKRKNKHDDSSDSDFHVGVKLRRNSSRRKSNCVEDSGSEREGSKNGPDLSRARKNLDETLGEKTDSGDVGIIDKSDEKEEDSEDDMVVAVDRHRNCIIDSDEETVENDSETETKVNGDTVKQSEVDTDIQPATVINPEIIIEHSNNLIGEVKLEPGTQSEVDHTKELSDGSFEIKLEKISWDEAHNSARSEVLIVNKNCSSKGNSLRHDSGIMADIEIGEHCNRDTNISDSNDHLIDIGVPGDEIEPEVLSVPDSSASEEESSTEDDDSTSSDSDIDIEVTSERTRVSMLKKKRQKEKLFEKFRAERARKSQRETEKRQSESQNETVVKTEKDTVSSSC